MKALSIHVPYIYEIIEGSKTEEYRTWKPKELGRILLCSSAKRYPGYVSGFALCTVKISGISSYPGKGPNGKTLYGWLVRNIRYVEPFLVRGRLHLFDVDDHLIKELPDISFQEYMMNYYEPLISW